MPKPTRKISRSRAARPLKHAPAPQPEPKLEASSGNGSEPQPKRRLTRVAKAFLLQFSLQNYKDPEKAAKAAGIKRAGSGYRLAAKFSDIVEEQKLREAMNRQMEVDEALRLTAEIARDFEDKKTSLAALRTILQVHGVLSDKPIVDRRDGAKSVAEVIERIKQRISQPGSKIRVKAILAHAELTSEPDEPEASEEGNSDPPSSQS